MANGPDSKLRFTIEESVWLRNGQEVAEVLSMSLNPEIMIEEVNEQILIKGYLYLTGEYRPLKSSDNKGEVEEESLKDQLQFRSMDQINEIEDGVLELEHRFPVDITIPKQRISNVNEVYVNVESFDYDLPSYNCIELTADVEITGLNQDLPVVLENNEEYAESRQDSLEEDVPEMVEVEERTFEEFEFEARKAPKEEEEEVTNASSENEHAFNRNRPPVVELKSREPESESEYNDGEDSDRNRFDYEEYLSPLKSLSSYPKEDTFEEESYNANKYAGRKNNEHVEEKYVVDNSSESDTNEDPRKEENALYLTSMLTRGDEEFSRLKMCIIQPGDSLDTVAGRYEVTTSHLVRMNRLDNEEVSEGQILYIPIPAGRV